MRSSDRRASRGYHADALDLLRTLLRLKAEQAGVAGRLVAGADELDRLAAGKRDLPALKGWRREVFGADAVDLIEGRLALALSGDQPKLIQLPREG